MAVPLVALATPAAVAKPPSGAELPPGVTLHAIDLDGLVVDSVLDFNLYLPAGPGRYVFFRSPNLAFLPHHRRRLLDNGVRRIYIRSDERERYARYLEQNLGAVLANPEVPARKKVAALYSVSTHVVQEAFDDPRSATIVPRAKKVATQTVDYVLRSERTIARLALVMSTDYYTFTHSINVAFFAVALASRAGVSRADIAQLATGALLHDLGKTQIPKELITKGGPLTDAEMQAMREHVVFGEHILDAHEGLSPMALLPVREHHEKLDGTGYPRSLPNASIHLFGRITGIADCFDAMTTNRSYQKAFTAFEALQVMRTRLKDQYDQDLLEHFIRMLKAG